MLKIYDRGSWKTYNKIINHIPYGLENVFGIMKDEDGDYAIYITDEERGGVVIIGIRSKRSKKPVTNCIFIFRYVINLIKKSTLIIILNKVQ